MELALAVECWLSAQYLSNHRDSADVTFIAPSKIPNSGNGLFASKDIDEGTLIGHYSGKILRTRDAIRLKDKQYLMRLGPQCYIDAKQCLNVTCRYMNDIRSKLLYNVKFIKLPEETTALIVSTKKIRAKSELYVDYGPFYWLSKQIESKSR